MPFSYLKPSLACFLTVILNLHDYLLLKSSKCKLTLDLGGYVVSPRRSLWTQDQILWNAVSQASIVLSRSFWVWARERNQASNWGEKCQKFNTVFGNFVKRKMGELLNQLNFSPNKMEIKVHDLAMDLNKNMLPKYATRL